MIELTEQPIDMQAVTDSVRSTAAGAVVLFLGTVREFTNGTQTSFLEYAAYPQMAVSQLQQLCSEAQFRFDLVNVSVVHRTGRLGLGEISVAVAVSAAHRGQAFSAGQWLMDELKQRVPIWKKEHYADGREEWQHPETGKPGETSQEGQHDG
jgi:molybdopterin synthase catalytic subunit